MFGVMFTMIFSLRSFANEASGNSINGNTKALETPNKSVLSEYHVIGGVCYKYRWGDYYVGSSNVYFGGSIKSYNAGTSANKDYLISSSTPCCLVCSFNETGNNNPSTITEIMRSNNYSYSQIYIVFGTVTLTTSIFYVPIQTSKVKIISNVLADPNHTCLGKIKVNGKLDYSGMIGGISNIILTVIGFL